MSHLIDLDEFLRQNCVDRMEGKSCEECKHHVLEVSCERLMEQPTAEKVGKWIHDGKRFEGGIDWMHCSVCGKVDAFGVKSMYHYCPNCGARMMEGEEDE